jgi:hypothetical protein
LVLDFLSDEPTPAVKKAVKAGLAEFEKHKTTLLGHLSRSGSFDEEKCWIGFVSPVSPRYIFFGKRCRTPPSAR